MTIADTDPEDAYDASDPIPVRLANLLARLAVVLDDLELPVRLFARLARIGDDVATVHDELAR